MDVLKKAIELNGKKATIIRTNAEVIIKPIKDPETNGVVFNHLYTYAHIEQGNLVKIDNIIYLVLEKDNNLVEEYNKATISKAELIIWNNTEIYGYVSDIKNIIKTTENFAFLSDKIEITIPSNDISINDIVSYKNSNFKIISIDNTKDGLLTLIGEYVKPVENTYNIEVRPSEIALKIGDTATVEVIAKKNGIIDIGANCTYTVSDDTICNIKDNVITGIKEGTATITVTYFNVSASINVVVSANEEAGEDFTGVFKILGTENVKVNAIETYNLDPSRKTVTFRVDDSTIAEIVEQGNGTCTLKGLKRNNYVLLECLTPAGTVIASLDIMVY